MRRSLEALESPFLDEAPLSRDVDRERSAFGPTASEEEVLGQDDRTLVTDTFKIPNRWICAIDVLTDNPKWGTIGEPQFLAKSRATGTLIGPRHVLTARHILGNLGQNTAGSVRGLTVSPARNGRNSRSPFGAVKSKAVHVSQPYFMRRTVRQGARVMTIPIRQHDDYALIILDKDLDSSTHSAMTGIVGYWGHSAIATLRRLDPADINRQEIVIIGYPGDTCGQSKWSGSKADKQKKIDNCWLRRNDEWASTQWRGLGRLEADASSTTVYHTADTYEGQSGAPICLSRDRQLHLVGVHTGSDTPQRNQGVRVTRRMLRELCEWINADAGSRMATIANDTLVLQPAGGAASLRQGSAATSAKEELFEQDETADFTERPLFLSLIPEASETGEESPVDEAYAAEDEDSFAANEVDADEASGAEEMESPHDTYAEGERFQLPFMPREVDPSLSEFAAADASEAGWSSHEQSDPDGEAGPDREEGDEAEVHDAEIDDDEGVQGHDV